MNIQLQKVLPKVDANGSFAAGPPPRRLIETLVARLRYRHCSLRTEQAYLRWVRRSVLRHPRELGAEWLRPAADGAYRHCPHDVEATGATGEAPWPLLLPPYRVREESACYRAMPSCTAAAT